MKQCRRPTRPAKWQWPWVRLVPLLTEDFDENQKADDHLMSRVETEGMVPVDSDYDAGAKARHG
jgi:hypothetical protein